MRPELSAAASPPGSPRQAYGSGSSSATRPARPDLPDVEIAQATYDDADALREAFAGTDAVFLVSAAEHPERVRQHLTAVDAVAAAGVERVVYTSHSSAPRPTRPSRSAATTG